MAGELADALCAHLRYAYGSPYVELIEIDGGVDLVFVAPTEEFPVIRILTCGASARPQPSEDGSARHVELTLALPGDWHFDGSQESDWPADLLVETAGKGQALSRGLSPGVTPTGEPAYFPGTDFVGAVVGPVTVAPQDLYGFSSDGHEVEFLALIPVTLGEFHYKQAKGGDKLLKRLRRGGVTDLVDIKRWEVAKRKREREYAVEPFRLSDEWPGIRPFS